MADWSTAFRRPGFFGGLISVLFFVSSGLAEPGSSLLTVNADGTGSGNGTSFLSRPVFSADGRYVAFASEATNLTSAPAAGRNVYWRDLEAGVTRCVTLSKVGYGAGGVAPSISADGRVVAFWSDAINLAEEADSPKWSDVFVRDMSTGKTTLVSASKYGYGGNQNSLAATISADGRHVVFASVANDLVSFATPSVITTVNVYVRDLLTKTTQMVSVNRSGTGPGNRSSQIEEGGSVGYSAISRDGRYVVFSSAATDLVEGDMNEAIDIFVLDMTTGVTKLISANRSGTGSCIGGASHFKMTPDGRFIAFYTASPDVVGRPEGSYGSGVLLYDRQTGTTRTVGTQSGASGASTRFVHAITPDGRSILFYSYAEDMAVIDTAQDKIRVVSLDWDGVMAGNAAAWSASISDDGRYVAFDSWATNLVDETEGYPNNSATRHVYLRDMLTETTRIISLDKNGEVPDRSSAYPVISPDGRYVAFESESDQIVTNDSNGTTDVFLYPVEQSHARILGFPRLVAPSPSDMTGFAFVNEGTSSAELTLSIYDADGKQVVAPGLENPATFTMEAGRQLARMESELFGGGLSALTGAAWVSVASSSPLVTGFFMNLNGSLTRLDGAVPFATPFRSLVFSEVGKPATVTTLYCTNPSARPATVAFQLVGGDGSVKAVAPDQVVAPRGLLVRTVAQLFPGSAAATTDYITAQSDVPIAGLEYLSKGEQFLAVIGAQHSSASKWELFAPQFARNGLLESTLSVINLAAQTALVSLSLHRDDGSLVRQQTVEVRAKGKAVIRASDLFSPADGESGYLRVSGLNSLGSVLFQDPSGEQFLSGLPLAGRCPRQAVFGHLAHNSDYFTGIALLNPSSVAVEATMEVSSSAGQLLASKVVSLPPYGRISRLLPEYMPELAGITISSGSLRITCETGLVTYALFGRWDLSSLAAIPGQMP